MPFLLSHGVYMTSEKFLGVLTTANDTPVVTTVVLDNEPASSDYAFTVTVGAVGGQTGTTKVGEVTLGSRALAADSPTALNVQDLGTGGFDILANMANSIRELRVLGDDPSWKGKFVSTSAIGISGLSGAIITTSMEAFSRGQRNHV
jgi:hypothetical protein